MKTFAILALALAGALTLGLAACGSDGHDAHGTDGPRRTMDVTMADNEFMPRSVSVRAGETVTFRFHNDGSMPHDAFVGDEDAQMGHEQEMSDQMSDMGHHGDDDAITVAPGEVGTLTHTFEDGGSVLIGCHQPGHYAAGMKMAVRVSR